MNSSSSYRDDNIDESSVQKILIHRQPPSAIFLEETFETEIAVDNTKGSETFDVATTFIEEGTSLNRLAIRLAVLSNPSPLIGGTPGVLRFSVSTLSDCIVQRSQIFRIHISVTDTSATPEATVGALGNASVATGRISVVLHKILLSPTDEWSRIWYKDEGGRDKSMEILAGIYDHQRNLLYEPVPLVLTLCYGSSVKRCIPPIPVVNQGILRVLAPKTTSTNQLVMHETDGKIKIRFRVEDVSKNHQGQDFCLQVAVDNDSDGYCTIAPGHTPLVTIRSKRNKRGRQLHLSRNTAPVIEEMSSTGNPHGLLQSTMIKREERPTAGEIPQPGVMLHSSPVREALHGIAQWVDEVVPGLYSLQWQGDRYPHYASRGNPDYNRHAVIDRVLSTYNDTIRHHLSFLQHTVDETSMHPPSESPRHRYAPTIPPQQPPPNDPRFGVIPPRYSVPHHRDYRHTKLVPYLPEMISDIPRHHLSLAPSETNVTREREFVPPSHHASWSTSTRHADSALVHAETTKNLGRDTTIPSVQSDDDMLNRTVDLESKVEHIVAQDFASVRTSKVLGLPAFDAEKALVGFYFRAGPCGPFTFVPVDPDDFGFDERRQATVLLEEALETSFEDAWVTSKPPAASLADLGSIQSMLDHILVFEFNKPTRLKRNKKLNEALRENESF